MGGIQKSLINLLNNELVNKKYKFSLLLFSATGELMNEIPDNVDIISPQNIYRILGLTKDELRKYPLLFIQKALFSIICRIIGRRRTMKLFGLFQKKYKGYDVVISFSHLSNDKTLTNGCGEFALDKTISKRKICFIHCDYKNSGTCSNENNKVYAEFECIACCSDSVKDVFISCSGIDPNRVVTMRNFYNHQVEKLAENDSFIYDESYINLLIVARLSREKGIDIALDSLAKSKRNDIRFYIVGDGPEKESLIDQAKNIGIADFVFFCGTQINPYRYMRNADYLIVPSRHEAAPIVFDEAKVMRLPVISSRTTSANEMLNDNDYVVDNFEEVFYSLRKSNKNEVRSVDNSLQNQQFIDLVERTL